jgi:hypothetical protein
MRGEAWLFQKWKAMCHEIPVSTSQISVGFRPNAVHVLSMSLRSTFGFALHNAPTTIWSMNDKAVYVAVTTARLSRLGMQRTYQDCRGSTQHMAAATGSSRSNEGQFHAPASGLQDSSKWKQRYMASAGGE